MLLDLESRTHWLFSVQLTFADMHHSVIQLATQMDSAQKKLFYLWF